MANAIPPTSFTPSGGSLEDAIKEVLASSLSVAENVTFKPERILRYWVEVHPAKWVAYADLSPGDGNRWDTRIYRWHLSYQEFMAYRHINNSMRKANSGGLLEDDSLAYLYEHHPLRNLRAKVELPSADAVQAMLDFARGVSPIAGQNDLIRMTFPPAGQRVEWRSIRETLDEEKRMPPPSIVHKVTLIKVTAPPDERIPNLVFMCSCSDEFFCLKVASAFLDKDKWKDEWKFIESVAFGGSFKICIPLFKCILHRVDCQIFTQKDWQGIDEQMLEVRIQTHRPNPASQYFPVSDVIEGRQDPFNWIMHMIASDVNNDPLLKMHYNAASEFVYGGRNHGCTDRRHGYAINPQLRGFVHEAKTHVEQDERIAAMAFSSAVYNKCFICYRASDLAFAMVDPF